MSLRNALLVLPAVGVLGGVGLVVTAARSGTPPDEASLATPRPMSAVSAGTVVLDDAGRPVSAFELDPTEVSVAEYARCVRAGACVLYTSAAEPRARLLERHHQSELCRGGRPDRADEPMNCVDWSSADAYCRWAGKRLPTREEWRHAVGRRHPDAAPELHRPAKEQSWYAAEWTASPAAIPNRDPWPALRWLGQWRTGDEGNRTRKWEAFEDWAPVEVRSPWLGFRCAR